MKPTTIIHESWNELFSEIRESGFIKEINKLDPEKFYPARESVFNVFRMPLNEIKVVILGQDPYPQENQAIGYAFAVSHNTKKPFSLRVIEKEIGHPIDKTLQEWREQGVFLLNTALTVEKWNAGSHIKVWKPFTERVISYISSHKSCIWMLWGKHAQEYEKFIVSDFYQQHILKGAHPAAEAYGAGKFTGCQHFTKTNEILSQEYNSLIINW